MYDTATISMKVKKLLALAARAGTEDEAVAAAAKAQEMIELYNLAIGTETLERESAVEQDGAVRTARISPHLSLLGRAACRLFDCEFYFNAEEITDTLSWRLSYRRTLRFVGLANNVEGCVLTFNYFAASVESLLWGARNTNRQWNRSELRAYRLGCSKRILSIASEVKEQRTQLGGEQVHALVRVGLDIAKQHIAAMNLHIHRVDSSIYTSDQEAYSQGFEDGTKVDIHGARSSRMLA
jgi:hypothetical protein